MISKKIISKLGFPHKQRGSSLVEIMVTLVLFSIGMLGLAGLQGSAIRFTEQSNFYTQAEVHIADIVARMRANSVAVLGGSYDDTISATPSVNCLTTACTAANFAEYDLSAWDRSIKQVFPNGEGSVVATVGVPMQFTVSIVWVRALNDQYSNTGGTNCAKGSHRPTNELAYCVTVNLASAKG
jgi:type IV pilus assembly protein PilV